MKIFSIDAVNMGKDQDKIAAWVENYIANREFENEDEFHKMEGELITAACKALNWHSIPSEGGLEVEWKETKL